MKFIALALAAILPVAVLGQEPTFVGMQPQVRRDESLEKRSVSGTVVVDGLHYRTCPRTSCPAIGQYAKGTHLDLICYTRDNTTPVDGD